MVFNNNLLLGAAGASAGYTIDQSIRLNDNDSAYLHRTPASDGNRKTWTFSTWIKRGNIGTAQVLFGCFSTYQSYLRINADNKMQLYNERGSTSNWTTTQVFRDPGAWMHVVWQYDVTQANAIDRQRLWINGGEVTDFTRTSTAAQNTDGTINIAAEHRLFRQGGSTNYYDGYAAEINFVDGTALDATSFGEYNDDGVWVPLKYTGSYGTNGFYIDGADSSFLGKDAKATSAPVTNKASTSSEWGGATGAYTFATNEIDRSSTINAIISTDLLSGDFSFDFTLTTSGGAVRIGVIDDQDSPTFNSTGSDGGMDSMTNSWYLDKGNNQFRYGGVSQGSASGVVNGAAVTIERTGSTIKITDDGSDAHTFSQTFSGPVRVVISGGGAAFNLDNVQYTADGASGNDNSFFSSGLTTADQRLDSPTLNKATLNGVNLYTTGSVLSDGNLTVTNSGTSGFWHRSYATQSLSYKTYWEVHADNLGSLNMGVSSLSNPNGGINNPAGNNGAGIQTNEAFVTGSYANESSGGRTFPISTGNYIMFAFDPDRGALWAGTEGTWKDGTASSASSATILAEIEGTGTSYALFTGIDPNDAIPHIAQYSTSVATARFSSEDWEGTAPTGYEDLSTANLPDPTIAVPEKYFNTVLYEGNGGGQRVGQFQPITETYTVPNSVIFNDDDSAYLTRTPSSASNKRTWTFSAWAKRGNIGADRRIFTAASNGTEFFFDANDKLNFYHYSGGFVWQYISNAVFKDSSAWNHFVLRVDTTNATSGDRIRVYVNGVQITDWGTSTAPSLNAEGFVNGTSAHYIGRYSGSDNNHWDGYLAEINHIDGSSLGPDSFGQLDASTNRWIPKDASGLTFGTNGFYLDMETAPGTGSGAGTDSSGNGNNFTETGFAATDQVTDSPTDNFSVLNPNDNGRPANITLSDGNLTAAFAGAGYSGGIRSSIFFDSEDSDGWYAECTLDSLAIASVFRAGVANASLDLSTADAQTSADGWAYSDQGAKLNNSYTTGYGSAVTPTDIVGIAVRNGKIYFAVNNTWQGSSDPVTESNPAFSNLTGDVAFCQSTNTGGSYAHTATWNFGQKSFAYTPPTGYKTVSVDNLPLSNGELSAFVWIKNRDAVDNHMLFDAVRGVTKDLHSNAANAEVTNANTLTRFLKNGFEVSNDVEVNTSGESYVAWQWLTDSLSTSSNTDGTLTSTVLNNSTSNFSIVKYTGTGSGSPTVGHGLGVTPDMIILKHLGRAQNWRVFHTSEGAGETGFLNSTAAWAADPDRISAVSSTTFTAAANMNESADYIAYCFANVDGFSKFGTFTGNGSTTDGPFIYTGFTPEFFMWKRADSATYGDWTMMDTKRDPFNMAERNMRANSTIADDTGEADLDFVSNGIKHRGGSSARFNQSGATYVYMAFASSPFKTATAR